MPLTDKQIKSFSEAAQPLMAWLNANVHPHHTVIADVNGAELLKGRTVAAAYPAPREEPKEPEPEPEPEEDVVVTSLHVTDEVFHMGGPCPPKNPENTIAAFLRKEAALLKARTLAGDTPWAHPPLEGAGMSPKLIRESKNPSPPDWRPEPPPPPPPKIADPSSSQWPDTALVPAPWTPRTDTPAQLAGKRFKAWRKFRGIKRAEAADDANVSTTHVREWEKGVRTPIPSGAWRLFGFSYDPNHLPEGASVKSKMRDPYDLHAEAIKRTVKS